MKIMIVDDAKLSRMMIGSRLPARIKESAQIIEAANGEEAVALYKEHSPDLVFLDLTMPVMDGFDALDAIKEYDMMASVIVITADIQARAKSRVLKSGALKMVPKPISSEKLEQIFSSLNM